MGDAVKKSKRKKLEKRVDARVFWYRPLTVLETRMRKAGLEPHSVGLERFPAFRCWKADVRTPAFFLEALARVFAKSGHKSQKDDFEVLWMQFKVLEDALGRVDAWSVFHEKAEKKWRSRSAVVEVLREQCVHGIGQADAILREDGWLNEGEGNAFNYITQTLEGLDWPTPKEFKRTLLRFLVHLCRSLENRLVSGEFVLADLEQGVHEVRRRLRWISIYAAVFSGQIQLGSPRDGTSDLSRYARSDILSSRHIELPVPSRDVAKFFDPITVPHSEWVALSCVIQDLGVIKDRGQARHALLETERILGRKTRSNVESAVRRSLGSYYITDGEAGRLAGRILDAFLTKDRVLSRIADDLESQS